MAPVSHPRQEAGCVCGRGGFWGPHSEPDSLTPCPQGNLQSTVTSVIFEALEEQFLQTVDPNLADACVFDAYLF